MLVSPCQPQPCCCFMDPTSGFLSLEVSPEKSASMSPEAIPKALLTEVWQSLTTSKPLLESSGQGSHSTPVIPSTGQYTGMHLFMAQPLPSPLGELMSSHPLQPHPPSSTAPSDLQSHSYPRSKHPARSMMNPAQHL